MQAEQKRPRTTQAAMLADALEQQRAACFALPAPSADERRADLLQTKRFVQANRQAIIEAV